MGAKAVNQPEESNSVLLNASSTLIVSTASHDHARAPESIEHW